MASSIIQTVNPCWGIYLSYEDHVNRHVPSGEYNHLVANIIMAEKRNEKIKTPSDTFFDIPVSSTRSFIQEKEVEEKRLSISVQKLKDELSQFTGDYSDHETVEEEVTSELPDIKEKSGKHPKWVQSLSIKKVKAEEMRKRKALLSSLKTQSDNLSELRNLLLEKRVHLSSQETLQKNNHLLQKALLGAERSYRDTKDQEYLTKNIHHNMTVWSKSLPNQTLVPRLVGAFGSYTTVMVPETYREIVPLSEYLREDW